MSPLEKELKEKLEGEVRFEAGDRALYATDASNYRQPPIGVVLPRTKEDILHTFSVCRRNGVPILTRGGGTSLAGQGCNQAVILDFTRYYNRILRIEPGEKWARVQPGLVLDELRKETEKFHLTFGPDPATHNRCSLGGMIGNNSCGVHSVMAGRTADNVLELEILTYDGLVLRVGKYDPPELDAQCREGGRTGEIFRQLRSLRDHYALLIRERYPPIPRRVSGYNLDSLLPESGFDLAKALVGSEGTCVCVLEAKLKLVDSPPHRALTVVAFDDLKSAADAVPALLEEEPLALEGIDDILVSHLKEKKLHTRFLPLLPEGKAWLFAETGAWNESESARQAERMEKKAKSLKGLEEVKSYFGKEEQEHVWKIRESGLGATAFVPNEPDAWPGWEDAAVPPERLGDYLKKFRALLERFGYKAALYGHFGQGCVHCRISFDLVTAQGVEDYHKFTVEAARLVSRYGGSLSGEHGDGQSRAELLPIMFGKDLVEAFRHFKRIWDPEGKMNPGKVVDAYGNRENLRLGTGYQPWVPDTVFQFPDDHHSFARASVRCVGVGLCRQHSGGVICPSYQVTREEKHSTRGRARLLFEMMQGEVIPSKWKNESVKEALDLCLACKGCKGECPVNVDMATYKAEFLHHYYKGRLRPRHAYAMGFVAPAAALASSFPSLANFFTQSRGFSSIAKWLAGIHPNRQIPLFADETFRHWYSRQSRSRAKGRTVVLWTDTFHNYFHPQVARSALHVLESAGFQVRIPPRAFCCGRPLYDFGFLNRAKAWLKRILGEMREEIRAGLPFIFLEPSCATVFRDELSNLFPSDEDGKRLASQAYLLSEFLEQEAGDFSWPHLNGELLVQGHCHHRSVLDFEKEKSLLKKVAPQFRIIPASCCGMAGSFGFEKEHYGISQALGYQSLFSAVNQADGRTGILANGFSCREQIRQGTGREARHLAEFLEQALAEGEKTERNVAAAG